MVSEYVHQCYPIKIAIIEDSEIHSEWLKLELESDQSFQVQSIDRYARKGIESIKLHRPDLVIIDFQLEDITGLEAIKRIKVWNKDIKTFMITAHTEISIIERILEDKNIDALAIKGSQYFGYNLISAIRNVAQGGVYIDPSLLNKLREANKPSVLDELTKREFEVFIQSSMGKSDAKISEDLCVELTHVKNIKSKISKKINKLEVSCLLSKLLDNMNVNYQLSN